MKEIDLHKNIIVCDISFLISKDKKGHYILKSYTRSTGESNTAFIESLSDLNGEISAIIFDFYCMQNVDNSTKILLENTIIPLKK